MYCHIRKLFFISLIAIFLFVLNQAYAKVITVDGGGSVPLTTPEITMAEKIAKGIELLKDSPPLLYETTGKNLKGNLVRKQIAFAVLDQNTGSIFEKRVWVKEKDIKNVGKTGVINLESAMPGEPLDIEVQWWNSFNSLFGIANRSGLVIIADKYLLLSSDLGNLPERSKNKYTDIVYVPYSGLFHSAEIIEAGKNYLEKNIDQAYYQLDSKKVFSRSSPGTL